ncbi:MAG: PHP domain-containing protein [Candidatus Aegiribacteria sp.]|nr:PHP domain-containing protein [Candidatus Aegiribacteria sp.]
MTAADLHIHTTCSDGELTPSEIVRAAKNLGFDTIAVTDHDTTSGISEALKTGSDAGIEVIPGIEITLRFRREYFTGSLHVLVYFSEELFQDQRFLSELETIVSKGRGPALVEERVRCINVEFGPGGKSPLLCRELTVEEISSLADNISRRHFAKALSERHGLSKEEISLLIGNDSPAYVPSGIDMELLKNFFVKYPVISVLAHPAAGSFPGDGHYKEVLPPLSTVERILPEFLDLGIKGLEVYYPGHAPKHVEHLLELAEKHDLVVTGGSDCHDDTERPLLKPGMVKDISAFLALLSEQNQNIEGSG